MGTVDGSGHGVGFVVVERFEWDATSPDPYALTSLWGVGVCSSGTHPPPSRRAVSRPRREDRGARFDSALGLSGVPVHGVTSDDRVT